METQTNTIETLLETPLEAGDLLVRYLEQIGVEYVFGVPGGAIEPLYNALARSERRGGVRAIVARHETGAAFMADGYARETGKLGVCCATTGPGATNLITGVASAYQQHTPMLVITAQTGLSSLGKGACQESSCTGVNILGMFQFCTRYNAFVSHVDQLESKLIAAVMSATQDSPGPAHLSIPINLLCGAAPVSVPQFDLRRLMQRPSLIDEQQITVLFDAIQQVQHMVLVLGDGCIAAMEQILAFAEAYHTPIVVTPQGKGLLSAYHPLFRGVFGFAGHSSAEEVLRHPSVDLILAVGTGLGEWPSNGWDPHSIFNEKLVHIDNIDLHFTRSPVARLQVRGSISATFARLLEHGRRISPGVAAMRCDADDQGRHIVNIPERRGQPVSGCNSLAEVFPLRHFKLQEEAKWHSEATPIKPQKLMHELSRRLPIQTRILLDTGNSVVWGVHYLHPLARRRSDYHMISTGLIRSELVFASMGWAIGASVGTALGCPGVPVVCITGDGSLLMSGQEMTVALSEGLNIIYVVLNDSALGMVKHGQRLTGAEPIGYALPPVDLAAMALAMGIDAYTIRAPQDLYALDWVNLCNKGGPTLLDVYIDAEEVPPIGVRINGLAENRNNK